MVRGNVDATELRLMRMWRKRGISERVPAHTPHANTVNRGCARLGFPRHCIFTYSVPESSRTSFADDRDVGAITCRSLLTLPMAI